MTDTEDTEGLRLAAEERERLTVKVQDDRLADAPPERDRTTDQIRADRQTDMHLTTEQIQRDRREDEAPRTALELVRADKLTHSIALLESVRKLCTALLAGIVVVGFALALIFDYMSETRAKIVRANEATEQLEAAFKNFESNNEKYLDNHARTQRLICAWFVEQDRPLPANGDCAGR